MVTPEDELEIVPNDTTDPRFWAFWDKVRELTCPDELSHDHLDD